MSYSPVPARVRLPVRLVIALALALGLSLALAEPAVAEDDPTPSPTGTSTQAPLAPTETLPPTATNEPRPTATSTPTATPRPAQDLAVSFFNNFCEPGEPLLATVFNTSATPLESQTVRLRLLGEQGLLEEHDHLLSLPAYGVVNLPLLNPATPPWMQIEIVLLTGEPDPNAHNDSASCGVAVAPTAVPDPLDDMDLSPGTNSQSAPPPASGISSNQVWRPAAPTPTAAPPAAEPTLAPALGTAPGRAVANAPQPSLTPIGDAGGGGPAAAGATFPSRTLMMSGVVLLAAGTSWAFYYLTRPPRNA